MEESTPKKKVKVSEEVPVAPIAKAEKPKRERTEAQKATTAKALAALREKREALKKAQEEELAHLDDEKREEKLKIQQAKNQKRAGSKLPPLVEYITKGDLERFKKELFQAMPREVVREIPVEKEVIKEKVVPVERHVVRERVVEQPVPYPVVKQLSGNDLLDRIFFNK